MKKILSVISIMLLATMGTYTHTHASNDETSIEVTQSLLSISNGDIYKKRIDLLVGKISASIEKLEVLGDALINIKTKVSKLKEGESKNSLNSIVNYFIYRVDTSKLILEKEKINKENEQNKVIKKEIIIKKIYTKSELYEGFIDNYSDREKSILAGIETYVYNASIVADIEEIEAQTLEFRLESTNISNLKSVIDTAVLYVEGLKIKSIRSNDIEIISSSVAILKFDKLENFIIPKQPIEFRLAIKPQEIGFEKVGLYQPLIAVKEVKITKAEGLVSGQSTAIKVFNDANAEEVFQISPALLSVNTVNSLNDSYFPKLNIQANFGGNTQQGTNSELRVEIQKLKFNFFESNGGATYKIANTDNSSQRVTGIKNGNYLEFDISSLPKSTISRGKGEDFIIYITDNTDVTVNLELNRQGIIYSIPGITGATNITGYLKEGVSLGSRTY